MYWSSEAGVRRSDTERHEGSSCGGLPGGGKSEGGGIALLPCHFPFFFPFPICCLFPLPVPVPFPVPFPLPLPFSFTFPFPFCLEGGSEDGGGRGSLPKTWSNHISFLFSSANLSVVQTLSPTPHTGPTSQGVFIYALSGEGCTDKPMHSQVLC